MILETLRELADYLDEDTHGIAATLRALPRDARDALPLTPVIAEETTSVEVALGRPPATLPALCLAFDGVVDNDPNTAQRTRDASVSIVVRYVARDIDTTRAMQDAYYTARAFERSLDQWIIARDRNGISVYAVVERQYGAPMNPMGDALAVWSLRVTFQVRDTT